MYRELIGSLTYMYSIICRGKGIIKDQQLTNIAVGAHSLTDATCQIAEKNPENLTNNDRAYLKEAEKIDDQIEEMLMFLNSLEIV